MHGQYLLRYANAPNNGAEIDRLHTNLIYTAYFTIIYMYKLPFGPFSIIIEMSYIVSIDNLPASDACCHIVNR